MRHASICAGSWLMTFLTVTLCLAIGACAAAVSDSRRAPAAGAAKSPTAVVAVPGGLPMPWKNRDLDRDHINYQPGSARYDNGIFELTSGGHDVWHFEDYFHFVYQEVKGDGEIVARVVAIDDSGTGHERAGIVTRWDPDFSRLAAGDADKPCGPGAQLWVDRKGNVGYGIRTWEKKAPGGESWQGWHPADFWKAKGVGLPVWLRLVRKGKAFEPSYSKDGQTWLTPANSKGPVPPAELAEPFHDFEAPTMYYGLYATASDKQQAGKMTKARFDNVKITSGP